jgi:hypothetical protein
MLVEGEKKQGPSKNKELKKLKQLKNFRARTTSENGAKKSFKTEIILRRLSPSFCISPSLLNKNTPITRLHVKYT